jgi:pilus assembly protein CpaF
VLAVGIVEDEVRELVRSRALDPAVDAAAIRRIVDDVVADYSQRRLTASLPDLGDAAATAREVYDAVAGFGPL